MIEREFIMGCTDGVPPLFGASPPLREEVDTQLLAELGAARARVAELETVIREYVAQVDDGARFDALVSAVPGLESDDGAYPLTPKD